MSLRITEKNETFHLQGKLNSITSRSFIIHFEYLLSITDELNLNIDNVHEIDANGITAIKTIYSKSLLDNKSMSIIGYGCRDIYDEFRNANIA